MKDLPLIVTYGVATALGTFICATASAQGPSSGTTSPPSVSAPAAEQAPPKSGTPTAHPIEHQFDRQTTQDFIDAAAYSNRAEIAAARYVLAHSSSQSVQDFARRMIQDHGAALDQLQQVAARGGFTMPSGIDTKHRDSLDQLKNDRDARLSMTYASAEASEHKEAVAKFQSAAQNESIAPAVRVYASTILPKLEEHLRMAQRLVAMESKGTRPAG